MLELGPAEVHVWLVAVPRRAGRLARAWRELLPPPERARLAALRAGPARLQYVLGRGLLRIALSRYSEVEPRAWMFTTSQYGKPAVDTPGGSGLCFNLSHTHGLIACAVTAGREVGIDVESIARARPRIAAVLRWLTPEEARAVHEAPARDRARMAVRLWTLKEAYLKARGVGLAVDPRRIAFSVGPTAAWPVLGGDPAEDPRGWCFTELDPTPGHHLAIATRRLPGGASAHATVDPVLYRVIATHEDQSALWPLPDVGRTNVSDCRR